MKVRKKTVCGVAVNVFIDLKTGELIPETIGKFTIPISNLKDLQKISGKDNTFLTRDTNFLDKLQEKKEQEREARLSAMSKKLEFYYENGMSPVLFEDDAKCLMENGVTAEEFGMQNECLEEIMNILYKNIYHIYAKRRRGNIDIISRAAARKIIEEIICGLLRSEKNYINILPLLKTATIETINASKLCSKDDTENGFNAENWQNFIFEFINFSDERRKQYIEFIKAYSSVVERATTKKDISQILEYFEFVSGTKDSMENFVLLSKNISAKSEDNSEENAKLLYEILDTMMLSGKGMDDYSTFLSIDIIVKKKLPYSVERKLIKQTIEEDKIKISTNYIQQMIQSGKTSFGEAVVLLQLINNNPKRAHECTFIVENLRKIDFPLEVLLNHDLNEEQIKKLYDTLNGSVDNVLRAEKDYNNKLAHLVNISSSPEVIRRAKSKWEESESPRRVLVNKINKSFKHRYEGSARKEA
jgi:hypothetical protein